MRENSEYSRSLDCNCALEIVEEKVAMHQGGVVFEETRAGRYNYFWVYFFFGAAF